MIGDKSPTHFLPLFVVVVITIIVTGTLMAGSWLVGVRYGESKAVASDLVAQAGRIEANVAMTAAEVRDFICANGGCP